MNAMPVKNTILLNETVEELFANFGTRRVLFEIAARLFRKSHPPDRVRSTKVHDANMSAHMRKDIGLPFETNKPEHINPMVFHLLNRL